MVLAAHICMQSIWSIPIENQNWQTQLQILNVLCKKLGELTVIMLESTVFDFLHTATRFRLHTIADIWSKVGVLWGGLMYPKHPAKPLTGWLQIHRNQIFPMRYYMSLYLKGLQNCSPSKLAVKKKCWYFGFEATFFVILCSNRWGPGSIPGRGELWRPAVLQYLDIQGHVVPHWKALMFLLG